MAYLTHPTQHTLHRITQGDQAAFAEIYNHYRKPALKFCTSLLKDEEEAQNMLQEVFIKIWDRRAFIKPELNFQSYLFICLRNMVFDHLKKLEKNQLLMQYYQERMEVLVEEDKEERELRIQRLYAAMNSLSKKREQILRLNVEEGKTYQEIAETMHISKNTVKNQLVKAKQILKQKIDFASF
ncbi:RNA polymerase sigma-70 factor [Rhabdobacter roseus]|uniref:RNA polymerase sigma-70 factor (ECF subfamily) n=1 Tax=Rhabdobacter roseus TaxID=1655419 RepID=A0A840TG77_9BACT|nr:sigma-70 family RNA polymerase sigma factor [Rhabdobacter roseus]MBB5281945.1 RNA polymerase sigma-70 factor (ECF subfamily) [Rhabdobacter roseus]